MEGEGHWGGFIKRSTGPGQPSKWVPQHDRILKYYIGTEAERRLMETVADRLKALRFYRNEAHVEIVAEVARINARVWQRVADLAADQDLVGRLLLNHIGGYDRDPYMQALLHPEQPFGDKGAGPSHPPRDVGPSREMEESALGNYYPIAPVYQYPVMEPVPMVEEVIEEAEDESEEDPEEDLDGEMIEIPEVGNEKVVEPESNFLADDDLGEVVNLIVFRMRGPPS